MAKTAPNFTPQLLISGTSRAAEGGETFDLYHPATGAQIGKIPLASPADVNAAIAAAVLLAPGGFILGGLLIARAVKKRREAKGE